MNDDLTALLVTDSADGNQSGNDSIKVRLESLGYTVMVSDVSEIGTAHAIRPSVVVVSTIVGTPDLHADFRKLEVPVVVADGAMLEIMRLSYKRADGDGASLVSKHKHNSIRIVEKSHSLSASLRGRVEVTTSRFHFLYGSPGPEAIVIALLPRAEEGREREADESSAAIDCEGPDLDEGRPIIFAYDTGAALCEDDARKGANGLGIKAPARRVGFFIGSAIANSLNADGWALFDAAINWAVGEELKQFPEVYREEWQEIRERRQRQRITQGAPMPDKRANEGASEKRADAYSEGSGAGSSNNGGAGGNNNGSIAGNNGDGGACKGDGEDVAPVADAGPQYAPPNLVGLALSGGGIRSATFCLGLLQGMRRAKFLRAFDYVSTVSGGGYLGGWWSAWLSRNWSAGEDNSRYPFLNVNDIREPSGFAAKIMRDFDPKTAPLSEYLRRKCSRETTELLRHSIEDGGLGAEVSKALSSEINAVLRECCGERGNLLMKVRAAEPATGATAAATTGATANMEADDEQRLIEGFDFLSAEVNEVVKRRARLVNANGDVSTIELLRLNRMILEDAYPDNIVASIFPREERIEPERAELYLKDVGGDGQGVSETRKQFAREKAEVAQDLLCAGDDPSHHLRLFANYLTPRKGLLSGDTWRAAGVVSRNLILTWLILVPLIFAAVLLGQLFFAIRPNSISDFAYYKVEVNGGAASAGATQEKAAQKMPTRYTDIRKEMEARDMLPKTLWERASYAAVPSWMLLLLIVVVASLWMLNNNSGKRLNGLLGAAVVCLMVGCALAFIHPDWWNWLLGNWRSTIKDNGRPPIKFIPIPYQVLIPLWLLAAVAVSLYARRRSPASRAGMLDTQGQLDLLRNQAVRVQTVLLVALAVTTLVLFFAGFGHELVQFTVDKMTGDDGDVKGLADFMTKKIPQWAAVVGAVATFAISIFTAVKASPMGGGEQRSSEAPSAYSRIVFALAPPSMLFLLVMAASYGAHRLSRYVVSDPENLLPPLNVAMFAGIYLTLLFSLSEIEWRKPRMTRILLTATSLPIVLAGGVMYLMLRKASLSPLPWEMIQVEMHLIVSLAFALFFGIFILIRLSVSEIKLEESHRRRFYRFIVFRELLGRYKFTSYRLLWISLAAYTALLAVAAFAVWFFDATTFGGALWGALVSRVPENRYGLFTVAAVNMALCLVCVIFEVFRGAGNNRRALWLLAAAYAVLLAILAVSFSHDAGSHYVKFVGFDYQHTVMLVHIVIALYAVSVGWVIALGWMADPNALSMHAFYKERLVRAYLGASNRRRRFGLKDVTEADEHDDLCLAGLRNCQRGAPYHLINTTLNLAAGRDLAAAQRSSAMFVLSKLHCGSSRTGYRNTRKYMSGKLSLGTAVATSGAAASPNMGSRTPSASLAMLMTLLNVRLGYWAPTPNKEHWRLRLAQLWPFYTVREFLSQTHDLSSYCYLTDGGHFDNTGVYSLIERGCRFIVVADCGADPTPCYGDLGDLIRRCRIDFGAEINFDVDPFGKENEGKRPERHFVVGQIKYNKGHLRRIRWDEESIEKRHIGVIVVFKPGIIGDESPDLRQYKIENNSFPQQSTADQWFDESQFESYRKLGYLCAHDAFGGFASRFGKGKPFTLADVETVFKTLARKFCAEEADQDRKTVSGDLWKAVKAELKKVKDETGTDAPPLTHGFEYYMKEMIADGARRIGDMEETRKPMDAAAANIRVFTREAVNLANSRAVAELNESVFFAAKARRKNLFPFFDKNANSQRNGDSRNGHGNNGKR